MELHCVLGNACVDVMSQVPFSSHGSSPSANYS
uniref:Uncharacterized protein n=1 Tax=Arundo donax TaxID=35708 RepID=A0A0A9C8Q3_ARUDO